MEIVYLGYTLESMIYPAAFVTSVSNSICTNQTSSDNLRSAPTFTRVILHLEDTAREATVHIHMAHARIVVKERDLVDFRIFSQV